MSASISFDVDDPGEARVQPYNIPVWALIGYGGTYEETADAYQIPLDLVVNAHTFYASHKDAIDARLEENV